jgi:hypothetical protein
MKHAWQWLALAVLVLLLAACGGPQVDLTYSTSAEEVIIQADSTGGLVPLAYEQSHIPEFRLYGDGRAVWSDWQDGRHIVWEGRLSAGEIDGLLEWMADEGFFGMDDHYTVKDKPLDLPTVCVAANLVNEQKRVCEYYDGAPPAFGEIYGRLRSGAGVADAQPYKPEIAWVIVEPVTWDEPLEPIPWPEFLAPSPSGMGEGTWVDGEALAYLWQGRLDYGPWVVYSDGEGRYGLILQVPGLMPRAPEVP